jgi:hypothetical protein
MVQYSISSDGIRVFHPQGSMTAKQAVESDDPEIRRQGELVMER